MILDYNLAYHSVFQITESSCHHRHIIYIFS